MSRLKLLRLTAQAAAVAIVLQLLVLMMKLPRLLRLIESGKRDIRTDEHQLAATIRVLNRVARFRWFVIRNNCLKKSLLFYYFLLRSGVRDVRIHIGICKADAKLDGHAWLTLNGGLFQESEEFISKYAVIYSSGV